MKKTSIISINLKFLRIPIALSLFTATVITSSSLMGNVPKIKLNRNLVNFFISSQPSLNHAKADSTGVFSLLKTEKTISPQLPSKQSYKPKTLKTAKSAEDEKSTIKKEAPQVKFSNNTHLNLDAEKYNLAQLPFMKKDFSVLIVHTHTTESYTPSEKFPYSPTDTDRTTDKSFNMVKVGKEIEKTLKSRGIKVYHDTTINDYPSYNGSYNKSSANVANYIKNDPSIKIVLDVHRDAIESKSGGKVKYTTKINSEDAAKIMLVVGSNLSGLEHKNWEENMTFAYKLQQHISSIYPDLMRPINFRSQRFNQQLAPGAIIVEVGTNGNTLDEALLGARYFAEGLCDFIETQNQERKGKNVSERTN